MRDTLVVGCGDVGGPLACLLAQNGHRVWGLRRSNISPGDGVTLIQADLNRPETLRNLPPVAQVFYVVSASSYDEAGYRAAYVTGLENLLAALGDHPVKRLIYVSSTSVYGQNNGELVDEDSATQPPSYRGKIMLEGEALACSAPFPGTAVRFAGIYGPGRYYLFNAVAKGATWPSHIYGNRIHRHDCVAVLGFLAQQGQLDSVYLACDDEPAPMVEVGDWLRREITARGVAIGSEGAGRSMHGAKRCSNARLKALGYEFRYPNYRAGYAELLDQWAADRQTNRGS